MVNPVLTIFFGGLQTVRKQITYYFVIESVTSRETTY